MKKEVCYTKTNKKRRVTGETGMKYADPYTPGAGFMPGHIAGRKETLERAEKYLNTIVLGLSLIHIYNRKLHILCSSKKN